MAVVWDTSIDSARAAVSRIGGLARVDLLLLAGLVGLQYFLWFGAGSWWTVAQIHSQVEQRNTTVQALEKRNDKLAAEVLSLQNDSGAVAGLARRNLGLVGKNEIFVWVIPKSSPSNS
ncbi:septum formation initiator family protein [Acidithiobacillus sp. IBUN Pt1247-S3]|uniref:FtsB family cell division protein n=1 Tax=Acidithiobacillus sp. IBUN Pt1247-S3 TaxID=3166642 RepID=UPI0034E4E972